MKLKSLAWIVALFTASACTQAPAPTTNNPSTDNKVLGTVSLGIGTKASASSIRISSRAALPDNAITIGTPTFVDFVDATTNNRYLSATFPLTNNTATAFDNLTLYAFNKSGASVGGTAIQQLVNFVGAPASGAQSLLPIHKTDAGIPNPVIDSAAADFQGFTAVEASDVKTDAVVQSIITNADTVLQYGYVARNGSSRTINAGATGSVTIAYRIPDANVSAAYKFVANFVVTNLINTRVTRSLGDTTAAAIARANGIGASEVFFVGSDTDIATLPLISERVKNISISNSPVCLLGGACLSAPTLSLTGAANSPTNTVYTLGIVAEPSAGSVITDIEIDWENDGTIDVTLPGSTTTATHTFTSTINPNTISVTATDSSTVAGQTVTTTKNIAVLDAPSVSISGANTANTGVQYTLNITAAPAAGSTLSGLSVNWGDGSAVEALATSALSATHTFTTAGTPTITVTATDTNTLIASAVQSVTVGLSQPTVSVTGNASSLTGDSYSLSITAAPAAGSSLSTLKVDWGDGSAVQTLATNATSATHTFTAVGTPNITVTATDANTAIATATKVVTVSLPLPTLSISGSATASTNVSYTLSITAAPAAGSTLSSLKVDWGDGSALETLSNSAVSATHTFTAVGTPTITLTATDTNTATASATQGVTVSLSQPTVTVSGNTTVDTGISYSVSITAAPAAGSTLSSLSVNWGDGNTDSLATSATSASHTYTTSGVRTVTVSATDTNTATASATQSVTVGLSLPTVSVSGSSTASTGVSYALSITAASAPGSSISALSVNWGDGNTDTLATNATSASHSFSTGGAKTITVTVTDTNTASASATQAVTVSLSQPTVTASGAATANTGVSYTLTIAATAATGSSLSGLSVNWGDGNTDTLATSATSASHTFTAAGTPTITVTATDTNTATATATQAVTVSLSQPTVSVSGSSTASTGVSYTLNITAAPAAGSSLSGLKVNWGDGGADEILLTSATSATHTFTAAGAKTITVTATDTNTASATATQAVTVNLSQPTVSASGSATANTGVSYNLSITAAPAAGSTLSSLTVNWGDGSAVQTLATNATSATHTFTAAGTPTITVTATDTNTATASATQGVTVSLSQPTVSVSGSATATKGISYSLSITAAAAAGSTLSSLTVDWGDGSAVQTLATSATSATHTFTTTGAKTITVTATDTNTATASATQSVTVSNGVPTVSLSGNPRVVVNNSLNPTYSLYTLTITPTTPGATVTTTAVTWGDGSAVDSLTTHRYATKGSKTISVTITDSNGTTATATKTILVTPGIVISQFYTQGGAAGATFRADFVELFNASDTSIDVTGWSLQYGSATGAFAAGSIQANLTAVSIPAGGYYLIRMTTNTGPGADILTQELAIATAGLSNSVGKLALAVNTTAIPCGAALCTAAQLANVVDLVGYGAVNNFETASTTTAGTTTNSVKRASNGCTDTDNNSSDFSTTLTAAILRNSATTLAPCF